MRKILFASVLIVSLGLTAFTYDKSDVVVLEEDVPSIVRAYEVVDLRRKDYELALSDANTKEADAASNVKVTRKSHFLTRNEEGKLVFRVRPPVATK